MYPPLWPPVFPGNICCTHGVFTQENAERWQTEYALHMQAAGFDLERGIHGSKANHMDPAVYNAIKEEEAKLEAEKDELKMQKEVLEDEVDMLLSWEVAMSTCLVLVVVLSVAKLVGTVARKTRRTRTSDYVVGFMQQ